MKHEPLFTKLVKCMINKYYWLHLFNIFSIIFYNDSRYNRNIYSMECIITMFVKLYFYHIHLLPLDCIRTKFKVQQIFYFELGIQTICHQVHGELSQCHWKEFSLTNLQTNRRVQWCRHLLSFSIRKNLKLMLH